METDHRQTWHFQALDTWFFREARPFDTIGVPELDSVFPPPAPTVVGAVKTLIGQRAGIDWREFKPRVSEAELRDERFALLGDVRLHGPFVSRDGEPLFPAPVFLLAKRNASGGEPDTSEGCNAKGRVGMVRQTLCRLRIGHPVETDLGWVRLPKLPQTDGDEGGYKPLENTWLTRAGFETVLKGCTPEDKHIVGASELFASESRLGIARNNISGTAREGMLYQTRHIRPCDRVGLLVGVTGLAAEPDLESAVVRLGGEGRMAMVEMISKDMNLEKPSPDDNSHGLILILLTPADLDGSWYPPGARHEPHGEDARDIPRRWRVHLHGVDLLIHSAVLGKPRREGGWHLAEGKPRRVESLAPAGSAWYCTVENTSLEQAIGVLHGRQIGDGQKLGRGLLAVGLWPKWENCTPS